MPRANPPLPSSNRRSLPVIQALEKKIQESKFQTGDCLPSEKEIGAEFGVSRTVVRDALQALKARGMLESRRGSGTYVAKPGHTTIRDSLSWYAALQKDGNRFLEMMDLRILIETHCVRTLASGNAPLHEIKKRLEQMKKNSMQLTRFADADIAFHLAMVKASGHALFHEVALAVLPALGKSFARRTHIDPVLAQQVLVDHQKIYRYLEQRNPSLAESSLRTHLLRSRENLMIRLSEAMNHEKGDLNSRVSKINKAAV